MEYLQFGCQVLVGGVFAVSAGSKVYSRAAFADFAAATTRLTGAGTGRARQLAAGTVAAEIAVVVALIVPVLVPWGFAGGIGLLAVFSAAIVRSLRRGQRAPCRCFGASSSPLGTQHVARNAVLAAIGALGIAASLSEVTSSLDIGLACVVAFAALLGVVLTARLDDLIGLFRATTATSQLGKHQ
ncbi:methylamine utilization protein MauE [Kribbella amoyensis]|uniref:Methylamine utilization protein MauE n=1 Tax=Kribbella amoyensis TaxID=996641 RepID=A0A561BVC9_9ACTN|nr:MauE/DoxX family redox-associated membrane protein [Kribbella amoyensis]TWD82829.1 methylamine utilization protein MauE [Kribbella amoyensis]